MVPSMNVVVGIQSYIYIHATSVFVVVPLCLLLMCFSTLAAISPFTYPCTCTRVYEQIGMNMNKLIKLDV